jgi:hypothetical protein
VFVAVHQSTWCRICDNKFFNDERNGRDFEVGSCNIIEGTIHSFHQERLRKTIKAISVFSNMATQGTYEHRSSVSVTLTSPADPILGPPLYNRAHTFQGMAKVPLDHRK